MSLSLALFPSRSVGPEPPTRFCGLDWPEHQRMTIFAAGQSEFRARPQILWLTGFSRLDLVKRTIPARAARPRSDAPHSPWLTGRRLCVGIVNPLSYRSLALRTSASRCASPGERIGSAAVSRGVDGRLALLADRGARRGRGPRAGAAAALARLRARRAPRQLRRPAPSRPAPRGRVRPRPRRPEPRGGRRQPARDLAPPARRRRRRGRRGAGRHRSAPAVAGRRGLGLGLGLAAAAGLYVGLGSPGLPDLRAPRPPRPGGCRGAGRGPDAAAGRPPGTRR